MRSIWKIFVCVLLMGCGCASTTHQFDKPLNTLYDSILIEIQPTTMGSPTENTLDKFKNELERYRICAKKNINIIINDPVPTPTFAWMYYDIYAFEFRNRAYQDLNAEDKHIAVFIAYIPGSSVQPNRTNIVGLQYYSSSIATLTLGIEEIELPTLLHEFGHLIGLVDRDRREEPPINANRPSHCNNESCLMFWIVPRTCGDELPAFCEKCLRDIHSLIND